MADVAKEPRKTWARVCRNRACGKTFAVLDFCMTHCCTECRHAHAAVLQAMPQELITVSWDGPPYKDQ